MSHSSAPQPEFFSPSAEKTAPTNRFWLIGLFLLLAGLAIPVLGYVILPAMGWGQFAQMFHLNRLLLLFGAVIGGALYLWYLRLVIPRPQLILGFVLLLWPIVVFLNGLLLDVGINLRLRPLLLLLIALPGLWLTVWHGRLLWHAIPWFKYYLIFFLWMTLYTFIHNAQAIDPRLSGGGSGDGLVSVVQLTSYFYCLVAIVVSAVVGLKARSINGLFDKLNAALLMVSGLEALLTIAGYPFGLFTLFLDGFTRAVGIFSHPNPFAHHQGVLLLYLFGLLFFYQGERRSRMSLLLLLSALGLNVIAFLLGLSKTALAAFSLCALLMLTLNLAVPSVRRALVGLGIAGIVLVPLGLFGFEMLSGNNFFTLLESRLDDNTSMNWRSEIWNSLLADLDLEMLLTGHGFTAANLTVYQLSFNDAHNAQPLMMVHNAYIALLYDFGLMGYTMFLSCLSLIWQAVRHWLSAVKPHLRTEHSIILALSLYFLLVCGFDEMSYMFDAPVLYWALSTLLFCVAWRERQAVEAASS